MGNIHGMFSDNNLPWDLPELESSQLLLLQRKIHCPNESGRRISPLLQDGILYATPAEKAAIAGLLALVSWHSPHRQKGGEAVKMALIRFRPSYPQTSTSCQMV
jgi:hypothetical protein